jgi:D-3-phosphoglycerate dehydrogenase / 2-oxoglutarate reductase
LQTVLITDHLFPSIDLQREVIERAGLALGEVEPNCRTEDDIIERCSSADALIVQYAPITRRVLEALPNVKGVVRYGIGVDNIDVKAAKETGRMVSNVPNYCQEEVSDHTVAMAISLARRIPQDHSQFAQGGWGVGPFLPVPAFSDLTLGLIGFGSIARKVSDKARPFRFSQVAFDPFAKAELFRERDVEPVALEELFERADIISLHCPLTPETHHIINADSISRMRPGVLLINTARGPLVNEADLVNALRSGKILGAGLDVFEKEPLPSDSPLRTFANVVLTSHAASVSTRAVELLQIKAAEAARDILMGKRPEGALV